MNIYRQKSAWKILLLMVALLIVGASLWYSNQLARDIAEKEKREAELWADAYKGMMMADEDDDSNFEFEVISKNELVPLILTDEQGNILKYRNIDSTKAKNPKYIQKRLEEMKADKPPIVIDIGSGAKNYIYYSDSNFIRQLKFYPFVQLSIIAAFLAFAYVLFSTAKTSEQNQLWVGMAKETAHQLGTPISSLNAWLEILKERKIDAATREVLSDVQKDIDRLELVAERFSKIGSTPEMKEELIKPHLEKSLDYIRKRSSDLVVLELNSPENISVRINVPLFEWVIENLLKNALDAMSGKGAISVVVSEDAEKVFVDVKDSGKGIPKSDFNTVFQPGYTTKKRGWGLGLALSKRIIEEYHKGKIFVKESVLNSGTTFRISLPKGK